MKDRTNHLINYLIITNSSERGRGGKGQKSDCGWLNLKALLLWNCCSQPCSTGDGFLSCVCSFCCCHCFVLSITRKRKQVRWRKIFCILLPECPPTSSNSSLPQELLGSWKGIVSLPQYTFQGYKDSKHATSRVARLAHLLCGIALLATRKPEFLFWLESRYITHTEYDFPGNWVQSPLAIKPGWYSKWNTLFPSFFFTFFE